MEKNLDGTHVKVVTENGVVYLMGLVTREDGEKATEIARQTGGVQKVVKLFQYVQPRTAETETNWLKLQTA